MGKRVVGRAKKHNTDLKILELQHLQDFRPVGLNPVPHIQDDSKLLSGFPWPIIFKPETIQ
jgi:hypothetical protein